MATIETTGRIASDLPRLRRQAFVGRQAELRAFREALSEGTGPIVWHVHGLGGIGKTTLLRRLADEAREAGRSVLETDLTTMSVSEVFRNRRAARPDVLLVDGVERLPARLEPPEQTIVILAGREPLGDTAWPVRSIELGGWSPAEARDFLVRRGVPAGAIDRLLAFGGGHPLALSLAAAVAVRDRVEDWTLTPEVTAALQDRLVDRPPTPAHRRALEVCAHAPATTEDLLRAVAGPDSAELYEWLRGRRFVEPTPSGLRAHDAVRAAVDADLKWRDPAGYRRLHEQVIGHLLQCVDTAGPAVPVQAVRSLYRLAVAEETPPENAFRGEPVRPGDRAELLALTEAHERPGAADLVAYWLDRFPDGFRAFRDVATGRIVAFDAVLSLGSEDDGTFAADPVVAAAFVHTRRTPMRPGERWLIDRFAVPATEERPPGLTTLIHEHSFEWALRTPRLAWTFITAAERSDLRPLMRFLDHRPVGPDPVAGYWLFAHDWRTVPTTAWLDRINAGRLYGWGALADAEPAVAVLSGGEFAAAVRDLLRGWHRASAVAESRLLRCRIAAGGGDPAETLRSAVRAAVAELGADRGGDRLRTVVSATFFAAFPTQNAVAHHLGLPFSTYRRHLSRGVDRVADLLWRREIDDEG
jgi:hypothetical protein